MEEGEILQWHSEIRHAFPSCTRVRRTTCFLYRSTEERGLERPRGRRAGSRHQDGASGLRPQRHIHRRGTRDATQHFMLLQISLPQLQSCVWTRATGTLQYASGGLLFFLITAH